MLVLISTEQDIENEIPMLCAMFEQGLEYFHLRKPNKSSIETQQYIDQIPVQFRKHIMLHLHHDLVEVNNLKGFHFQEQNRIDHRQQLSNFIAEKKDKGFSISSSFHSPVDIKEEYATFDYFLLSPVFASISKENYQGKGFTVNDIVDKKVIGMGGVTSNNIHEIYQMGYRGIGVLGGIWNSKNPVQAFQKTIDRLTQVNIDFKGSLEDKK